MGWALGPRSSGLQGQMKNWNVFQVQRGLYEQKGSSYLSVMTWSTFLPGEGPEQNDIKGHHRDALPNFASETIKWQPHPWSDHESAVERGAQLVWGRAFL